jgi:thiosulfate reductase cytochrome b subunit
MQFHWLAAIFGGFDAARVWHFWLMWVFILQMPSRLVFGVESLPLGVPVELEVILEVSA